MKPQKNITNTNQSQNNKEKQNLGLKGKGGKTFVSLGLLGKFGQVNLCVSLFLGSHGGRERSEN